MSKLLFKIWSCDRHKKIAIAILPPADPSQLYYEVIYKASQKLEIDGSKLVLENDGTEIDEETIELVSNDVLILLSKDEIWIPDKTSSSVSSSSETISASSSVFENILFSSTPTESNVINISLETEQQVNEDFWQTYEIPWQTFDADLVRECEKGVKNNKKLITAVIDAVVKEIRKIKEVIPSKCLKIIARKIIEKYPATFKDVDDDNCVLGDGTHSIFHKLQDRNNYLNRPHVKRGFTSEVIQPLKRRKLAASARAGCSNWQPDSYPSGENENTMQKSIIYLQDVVKKIDTITKEDENIVLEYLEKTYAAQRKFINEEICRSIKDVQKEWPILFIDKYLFWHYTKLMGHSINILKENLISKRKKILRFGVSKKLTTMTAEDEETDEKISAEAIQIIIKYFQEDDKFLIKYYEAGKTLDDVDPPCGSPCILCFDAQREPVYYIFVEGTKINNGTASFHEALKQTFAIYYIFNLAYPKEINASLEFIQRYLLKIHPDSGSKSKRESATRFKVMNFINKLKLF